MSLADRLQKDFTTITLALIPVAIVINIIGGQVVALLRLPVYLDSLGTMLVAILAGPIAGAITGALSNLIWSLLPSPIGSQYAWAFAGTAFIVGLLTGLFANWGWFKRTLPRSQAVALVLGVGILLILLQLFLASPTFGTPDFTPLSLTGVAMAVVLTLVTTFLAWQGTFPPLVAIGGVLLGIVSAIVSAPVAARVFGGVTGAGTDLLVAIFQASGLDALSSNLAQGLISDPFDKFVSYIVVWLIVRGMSRRLLGQFPRSNNLT